MGAEYYMGSQAGLTWQQARDKCKVSLRTLDSEWIEDIFANLQELDGDLASVPSYAVQKFLMDTFQDLDKDKWLGGQQSDGAFTWVTGDAYLCEHTTCDFSLSSDKLCLKMSGGNNGHWDGEDCSSNALDTYICQKGSK